MSRVALDALKGHALNVTARGEGPETLLALHGFTGNASQWDFLSRALRSEYRVIAVDLPGHGGSDAPDDPARYDFDHTIKALVELLGRLEISKVHWLGYSLGGRIALGAAVTLPQHTLSLTTIGASPGLASDEERTARRASDEKLAEKLETEGLAAFVDYWEALPLWQSQARLSPTARKKLHSQRLANDPKGLANSLRGIGGGSQPDFRQKLAHLRAPALFIAGAEDEKYAALAREMEDLTPPGRAALVPESGHAVHLEQPARLSETLLDFLREARNATTTGSRSSR